MVRFVIGPDVALRLAEKRAEPRREKKLLAPTLLRSHVLSRLYQAVRQDQLDRKEADRQLDHIRALRIRLLGDRVLQRVAWRLADRLGWHDTWKSPETGPF